MILYSIDRDELGLYVFEIHRRAKGGWTEMDCVRLGSIDGRPPGDLERVEGEEFFDATLADRIERINDLLATDRPPDTDRAFALATGR